MLDKNKGEMLDYTSKVASALQAYIGGGTKRDRSNLVEGELLIATSKKKFLTALIAIISEVDETNLE